MSIKAILLLIGLVAISAAITYWLVCLVRYDGVDVCDKTKCDNCQSLRVTGSEEAK